MNEERYQEWTPLPRISAKLEVLGLRDEEEGLEIDLGEAASSDSEPELRIRFGGVIAYRCINESYRSRTWRRLKGNEPTTTLLTVEHSKWIEWLEKESGDVLSEFDLTHYAILTEDDCIDVVTLEAPEVIWTKGTL